MLKLSMGAPSPSDVNAREQNSWLRSCLLNYVLKAGIMQWARGCGRILETLPKVMTRIA